MERDEKIVAVLVALFTVGLLVGFLLGMCIGYTASSKPQGSKEIVVYEPQQPKEWDLLFLGIVSVESEFNADATNGKHVGYIQARQQYIDDANRIIGYEEFATGDRYDIERCKDMFNVIQGHYNPEQDLVKGAKIHYMGSSGYKKNPEANDWYVRKVEREVEKIKVAMKVL
jgi:hypothetical protein